MNVGTKIKELRVEKGLTQERLAAAIGRTRNLVAQWERSASLPGINDIAALSNVFDIDPTELLDFKSSQHGEIELLIEQIKRLFADRTVDKELKDAFFRSVTNAYIERVSK